jgi:uncharacterized membrane protein affecting hemolysin expression
MKIRILLTFVAMMLSNMAAAVPDQSQLDAALNEVQTEERVFDAAWDDTQGSSLTARVFDDGTQRNGYAGYLCMIISLHGITGGFVRVVDVVSKDLRRLGHSVCK